MKVDSLVHQQSQLDSIIRGSGDNVLSPVVYRGNGTDYFEAAASRAIVIGMPAACQETETDQKDQCSNAWERAPGGLPCAVPPGFPAAT